MSCLSSIFRKRKNSEKQAAQGHGEISGIESVKIYSYKELRGATEGFSSANKIGEGGFSSVYKGTLKDGTTVAIKVLFPESGQGARELLTELTAISGLVHENLVSLYGCCVEGNHRILVYDYLVNNSLEQTLLGGGHNSIQFSWRTRSKICIGIAEGLTFLHEIVRPHIVHRDINASNILLDKDLTPKISDFGLAKLLPLHTTHVSTRVAGTLGYLAPEYAILGQLTRKADVYSFGVLLLEIVSGRCNTNMRLPLEERFLLERETCRIKLDVLQRILKPTKVAYGPLTFKMGDGGFIHHMAIFHHQLRSGLPQIWALYERGELMTIVDTSLNDDFDAEEACRFLKIGLLCTQVTPKCRPPMSTVIKMLTGERGIDQEITRPALISNFMGLVKPEKSGMPNTPSTMSPLSLETTNASMMTLTAIVDHD